MVRKLRIRAAAEHSQTVRFAFQLAFIALNVWIGIQFLRWVRWIEGTSAIPVSRPAGVEGWLPIAGLMNLKSWLVTRQVPIVHPASAILLVAFVAISFLLRKAFCSWLCPIGTLSEMLGKIGPNLKVPKGLDLALRGIKYFLFAFFALAIIRMPAAAIDEFMREPYGLTADIRLMQFFRDIGAAGLVVIAILVALSILIRNFWCRYLCPYGAFLSLASIVSPASITRDPRECIDCGKCAKACPQRLPVDKLARVRSAECNLCMNCVAVCPAAGALDVKLLGLKRLPAWSIAAGIATLFVAFVGIARITGHWQQGVTDEMFRYLLARGSVR